MSVVIESLGVRLGKRAILEGIDLELPAAAVTGLVGRNGAGKSTLLKAVVGIIRPSAGAVRFGDEADDHVSIGYLPEYVGFVEHLSGLRNLRLLADLGRSQNDVDPGALLDRVGLDGRDRRPVSTYSQGMRRRLGIAQAIMDGPSVVVLDEPANGLDPDGIRWARELVRDLARHGTCVIVASHLSASLSCRVTTSSCFMVGGSSSTVIVATSSST